MDNTETLAALNKMAHRKLVYYEVSPGNDIYLVFEPVSATGEYTQADQTALRRVLRIREGTAVEVPYREWQETPRRVWNHTTNQYDEFGPRMPGTGG